MATTTVVGGNAGVTLTVADIKANPMWIPELVVELLTDAFVEDVVLRDAGPNSSGLVGYHESSPVMMPGEDPELVEFEEIPVEAGQRGLPRIAVGTRKGSAIRISKEMVDENQWDAATFQITQLVNRAIRTRARVLRRLLMDPKIPTIPAAKAWDQSGSRPRTDYARAMEKINAAKVTPGTDDEDEFDFEADTTVQSTTLTPVLMDNDNYLSVYKDSLSTEDIRYKGKLPNEVMGMLGLQTRHWPKDRVLVVERKRVGFRSDTRPLQSTPLYPEGNGPNGGPTESWRSDTTYKRVQGIDQPLAACWITGVITP